MDANVERMKKRKEVLAIKIKSLMSAMTNNVDSGLKLFVDLPHVKIFIIDKSKIPRTVEFNEPHWEKVLL